MKLSIFVFFLALSVAQFAKAENYRCEAREGEFLLLLNEDSGLILKKGSVSDDSVWTEYELLDLIVSVERNPSNENVVVRAEVPKPDIDWSDKSRCYFEQLDKTKIFDIAKGELRFDYNWVFHPDGLGRDCLLPPVPHPGVYTQTLKCGPLGN
ncbi:MAG: hypothetical protein KDD25_02430 [Bdellovibrionales bacterium]|nr:hypothetical protein [Bdellovibrionales bacterium]